MFLISIREISVVVMLYSAKCKVLSILMLEYYQGRSPEEGMAMGLIIVFIALIVAAVMRFIFGMRLATR